MHLKIVPSIVKRLILAIFVAYGEWVYQTIVSALHLFLWTSLLYRQRYIFVSLPSDKCNYCKCPKCKCNYGIFLSVCLMCEECISGASHRVPATSTLTVSPATRLRRMRSFLVGIKTSNNTPSARPWNHTSVTPLISSGICIFSTDLSSDRLRSTSVPEHWVKYVYKVRLFYWKRLKCVIFLLVIECA